MFVDFANVIVCDAGDRNQLFGRFDKIFFGRKNQVSKPFEFQGPCWWVVLFTLKSVDFWKKLQFREGVFTRLCKKKVLIWETS